MVIHKISDFTAQFSIQRDLQSIEEQLQHPIDLKTCKRIVRRLETLQGECSKTHSVFLQTFQNSEEKIIYLFGKAVDQAVEYEVQTIERESQKPGLSQPSAIREKIRSLKERHCLSQANLQIIADVEQRLHRAEHPETPMRHFDWLASQTPVSNFPSSETLNLITEIYDFAELVYKENKENIQEKYPSLPYFIQESLSSHCARLGKAPFIDKLSTLQALFAVAEEMANTGKTTYASQEEINAFFHEKSQIE